MSVLATLPAVRTAPGRRDLGRLAARHLLPATVGFDQEQLDQAVGWLASAAIHSGGGLSRGYRLGVGWLDPAVGDSALAIPTLLRYHPIRPEAGAAELAGRLGAAVLAGQAADGAFPASDGASTVTVTGDALLALLALLVEPGGPELETAAGLAARWLVAAQGPEGSWAGSGRPNGRAAWALHRAASVLDDGALARAAAAHVGWLATGQGSDGWLWSGDSVGTDDLASVLEGLAEMGVDGHEPALAVAGELLAGVERAYRRPGSGVRLRWRNQVGAVISRSWRGLGPTASMEGAARLALAALRLARLGGPEAQRIRRFGDEILDAVRSVQLLHVARPGLSGGLPAAAPVWAAPGVELLVSTAKPFADALMERRGDGPAQRRLG